MDTENRKSPGAIIAAVLFIIFIMLAILYTLYPGMFGKTMEEWYRNFK
jgi:hypothetical protein